MVAEEIKTQTRQELFIRLYEISFPQVAAFVRKMGGSLEEAKDIFQDALIIFYEKKVARELPVLEHTESTYLAGIARNLWYKHYRETKKALEINTTITEPEKEPKVSESVFRFIEVSGKKCLELLTSFYYDKLNMNQIAVKFGFSGERSATAQKYKCLEKVRDAVRERSLSKEDFYE
jgi:DNA-directed RNA polymerase specialized sigma24 family protein